MAGPSSSVIPSTVVDSISPLTEKFPPSELTREAIQNLQASRVVEGCGTILKFCYLGETASTLRADGLFYIFEEQFRLGLHFPLCREMLDVLNGYGIICTQLMPNSIASVMTFVMYLRRTGQPWSLELFQERFSYKMYKNGFVVFTAVAPLQIEGLDNKLKEWKSHYCKVLAPNEPGIPRRPAVMKIQGKRKRSGLSKIKLDIRQYVLDIQVLKRVIYPEVYSPMTLTEWEESDDAQAARPKKKQHPKAKARRSPTIFESYNPSDAEEAAEEEETEGRTGEERGSMSQEVPVEYRLPVSGIPTPMPTSREEVGGPSDLPRVSGEMDVGIEEESEPQLIRRSERNKGKAVVDDEAATRDQESSTWGKVILSGDKKTAYVNLARDWQTVDRHQMSEAHEMQKVIGSQLLDERMEVLSRPRLKDLVARCQMTVWNIGAHFIDKYENELERSERLEAQLAFEKSRTRTSQAPAEASEVPSSSQLLSNTENFLKTVREFHNNEVSEYIRKIKDLEEKLKTSEEELKSAKVGYLRGGIGMCTRLLFEEGLLSEDWNDVDRILSLAARRDVITKPANRGDAVPEEEDSQEGGSTTVG